MKILLTGATGFVGSEVLRQALESPSVAKVTCLTRRPLGMAVPKLQELVLPDFTDYSQVAPELDADACIWCLGVSQFAVSKEEYVRITHDYAMEAARAMFTAAPAMRFCFVSGAGADREEHATAFNRNIKGRTEGDLAQLGPNVFIFRPAFIRPAHAGQRRPLITRAWSLIADVVDRFTDDFSVGCRQLARCLLDVAQHGAEARVFENRIIKHWP